MHPRWRRCSALKYVRYSRLSRLAIAAPRPSRCHAPLVPRTASSDSVRLLRWIRIAVNSLGSIGGQPDDHNHREWRQSHVADDRAGHARAVRQQRHAIAQHDLRSPPRTRPVPRDQRCRSAFSGSEPRDGKHEHGPYVRIPRSRRSSARRQPVDRVRRHPVVRSASSVFRLPISREPLL